MILKITQYIFIITGLLCVVGLISTGCYRTMWQNKRIAPNFEKRNTFMKIPNEYFRLDEKRIVCIAFVSYYKNRWYYRGEALDMPVEKEIAFDMWVKDWSNYFNQRI